MTTTKNGITSREILLVEDGQRILAVPKRMLDPRRPMKAANALTSDEKEEGLVPYHPLIEENPKEVITHKLQVRTICMKQCMIYYF